MKLFPEVFPKYRASGSIAGLVNQLEVDRIAASEDLSGMEIWLTCPCLAEHETFRELEKDIASQLFPGKRLWIRIHETFRLSGNFSPERLFDAYKDSIFRELQQKNLIAYRLMKRAEISFPSEHVMEITAEDMPLNRYIMNDLKKYLTDEVFLSRCGVSVELRVRFIPYVLPEPKEPERIVP